MWSSSAPPPIRPNYCAPAFTFLSRPNLAHAPNTPTPASFSLEKPWRKSVGEALSSWAQREIFHPLGMTSTYFSPPQEMRSRIPPTEDDRSFRKLRIQGEVQDENAWLLGGVASHAGLFSNVPDLLSFASEILSESKNFPGRGKANLFDSNTVQLFAERQGPEGSSRALGWDTPSENSSSGHNFSPHSIGHLGYSGCSLWIDLEAGVAVVLLTNRTWPNRESLLIREVRPAFHDAVRQAL